MNKRRFKILITTCILFIGILIMRKNITATKEIDNKPSNSGSMLALEMNSDVVKDVFSKLTLLEDKIKSEKYRDLYFKFDGEEKSFSIEEKLYILFENIYERSLDSNDDEIVSLEISQEELINEAKVMFNDEAFDAVAANFSTSLDCGIVEYLYTGQKYELKVKRCEESDVISKTRLEKAIKKGNFIDLTVRAYRIIPSKKGKTFEVKNFNDDEILDKDTLDNIEAKEKTIFDEYDIQSYIFSFELKGDDYYLSSIKKEN
ncbi:MAG: hypothetical protein HFG33_01100 [Bacilli bacterium]|nr:hypothetical protein [Bacilli bacterium]